MGYVIQGVKMVVEEKENDMIDQGLEIVKRGGKDRDHAQEIEVSEKGAEDPDQEKENVAVQGRETKRKAGEALDHAPGNEGIEKTEKEIAEREDLKKAILTSKKSQWMIMLAMEVMTMAMKTTTIQMLER